MLSSICRGQKRVALLSCEQLSCRAQPATVHAMPDVPAHRPSVHAPPICKSSSMPSMAAASRSAGSRSCSCPLMRCIDRGCQSAFPAVLRRPCAYSYGKRPMSLMASERKAHCPASLTSRMTRLAGLGCSTPRNSSRACTCSHEWTYVGHVSNLH